MDGNWSLPNPGDFLGGLEPGTGEPSTPISTTLTAKATPKRDKNRPYVAKTTGRLRGDLSTSDCQGTVRLVTKGKVSAAGVDHPVAVKGVRTAQLAETTRGCRFSSRVTVKPRREALAKRALRGPVKIRITFPGNETAAPASTAVRFRLG